MTGIKSPTETECIDTARKAAEKIVSAAKLHWVDKEFALVAIVY